MAVQAAITQFRKETVMAFQQERSLLSMTTTKESMMNGLTATFLVNGNATDTAVTRGQNGDIPYNSPTNSQVSATLVEKHAPYSLTGFDVFASQGNQTEGMRRQSIATINREIDLTVLAELANATQDFGTGTLELKTITGAVAALGNQFVQVDDINNMFGVLSPAAYNYLMQTTEFTSADYVDVTMFNGATKRMLNWGGVNWIVSSLVDGLATTTESLYVWHRDAFGYAINMGEDQIAAGFNEEQQRSWSLATVYHAAKILQNTGIIKITHDGSEIVTT
jgi:hypothetical protein